MLRHSHVKANKVGVIGVFRMQISILIMLRFTKETFSKFPSFLFTQKSPPKDHKDSAANATSKESTVPGSNPSSSTAGSQMPLEDKRKLFQEKVRLSNEACQNSDFERAIRLYTEALVLDPANHILYSNRSAAHIKLKQFEKALHDATKARELNAKWSKVRSSCMNIFISGKNVQEVYQLVLIKWIVSDVLLPMCNHIVRQ